MALKAKIVENFKRRHELERNNPVPALGDSSGSEVSEPAVVPEEVIANESNDNSEEDLDENADDQDQQAEAPPLRRSDRVRQQEHLRRSTHQQVRLGRSTPYL